MAQILFFGASTVYGVGSEVGGAPDIIKTELHKQAYSPGGAGEESGHEIYNLGIPGATSALLLERLQNELSARVEDTRKLIVLISVGVNDSRNIDSEGSHFLDVASYGENIEAIFGVLAKAGASVIAYGFTPVDEAKTMPIIDSAGGAATYFSNNRIKEFEKIFMQVAKEKGAQTLPLFEQAIQESWSRNYLYNDGLHPNTAGHAWITEKIKPTLWNLLAT